MREFGVVESSWRETIAKRPRLLATMVSLHETPESSVVLLTAAEPAISSPTGACATVVEPPAKKRRTRVGFSEVQIYEHEATLTNDRIPSTGGPSIGLGNLRVVTLHRMDSFDQRRDMERTGVRHIDADERREVLSALHRCESVEAVEQSNELVQRWREESCQDPTSPRVSEQPPSQFLACNPPTKDPDALGGSLPATESQFDNEDEIGISDLW